MNDIVNYVCDLIEDETTLTPVVGAMPPLGGIGVQQSSGSVVSEYLPRTALNRTTLVINSKDRNQSTALQNLVDIHEALTKRIGYETTNGYQILSVRTSTAPDFLGQENDESYMYGSSVEVLWYDKKKAVDTPL